MKTTKKKQNKAPRKHYKYDLAECIFIVSKYDEYMEPTGHYEAMKDLRAALEERGL